MNPHTNSKVNWRPIEQSIEQQIPITLHRITSTSIPDAPIIGSTANGIIRPFTMDPTSYNGIVNSHDSPISTKTMIPYKQSIPIDISHQHGIIPMSMSPEPHNHHHYSNMNTWPLMLKTPPLPPPPIRSVMGISPPHSTSGLLSKKLSLLSRKYLG
ncbi:hypothetical protein BLA29_004680 [Euroglyphus maynei]|uniref:Uncharacterized protein n=1 Tax=Euroglyphus maynei TaxID=6958 RepID=A0A1Y3B094_EURMA|nr:hypothetical protein BLA29_004680 [Euroglyphus maynei]